MPYNISGGQVDGTKNKSLSSQPGMIDAKMRCEWHADLQLGPREGSEGHYGEGGVEMNITELCAGFSSGGPSQTLCLSVLFQMPEPPLPPTLSKLLMTCAHAGDYSD